MKRDPNKLLGLSASLREQRGQILKAETEREKAPLKREKPKGEYSSDSLYAKYIKKRQAKQFNDFNSNDLCFYYAELARLKGITYSIRWNIDSKAFVNLSKDYSSKELVIMMDYAFSSDCKLKIDLRRFSPAAIQPWKNSLYVESQEWHVNKLTGKGDTKPREWRGDDSKETKTKIGEW